MFFGTFLLLDIGLLYLFLVCLVGRFKRSSLGPALITATTAVTPLFFERGEYFVCSGLSASFSLNLVVLIGSVGSFVLVLIFLDLCSTHTDSPVLPNPTFQESDSSLP